MKNDFKHKVVVITGATGGIGRALAWRFATAGARIALVDLYKRQLDALQLQVERSGTDVISIQCDITDMEACESCIRQAKEYFGGIDVLINNAGVTHYSAFAETDMSVFRKVMEVNYFGTLNCTRAALQSLIERKGMIITMSSILGKTTGEHMSGYSASKYALHGLFGALRAELQESGVHVMIACPGRMDTGLNKHAMAGNGSTIEVPGIVSDVQPNDVAEAIFVAAQKNKNLVEYTGDSWLSRL
jgi:short-subunit dehydrogenase